MLKAWYRKLKEASGIVGSLFFVIYLTVATSARYSASIWNTSEIRIFLKSGTYAKRSRTARMNVEMTTV